MSAIFFKKGVVCLFLKIKVIQKKLRTPLAIKNTFIKKVQGIKLHVQIVFTALPGRSQP
jgi:hypothetical protein